MPKVLLPITHLKQRRDGDCLAACAAMILDSLGRGIDYSRLLQLLGIKNYGAPAGNIRFLVQLGLNVEYSVTDSVGVFRMLAEGKPLIVFVRTGDLPYWKQNTDHAVVVVGYDSDTHSVYLNDPYFEEAPILVPQDFFELAWLERDNYYALITI